MKKLRRVLLSYEKYEDKVEVDGKEVSIIRIRQINTLVVGD